MPLPRKLVAWSKQPGAVVTPAERNFCDIVSQYREFGIGYGWMQQTIEWMWQEWADAHGLPGSAWGPESFAKRIADLEAELERAKRRKT